MDVCSPYQHFCVLIIFLATSAINTRANSHQCRQIFIGGSHIQPHVVGHYILQTYTYNNRLVYRHTCANYVLFAEHSQGGAVQWTVAPHEGGTDKYVTSAVPAAYPRDVTSWLSWHTANSTFVADTRIFFTCADFTEDCRAFIIHGPDVPTHFKGPYQIHRTINDMTSYKHIEEDVYVFHHNESGCARWVVGNHMDDNRVYMQSLTDSRTPMGISEQWTISHSAGHIQKTYSVHVECIGGDPDLPTCGNRQKEKSATPYLLSGTDTYPGKWPFMVSYTRTDGVHKCGGALLNSRWVLTAGHCVSGADISNETIILGAYNLDVEESPSRVYRIKSVHIHPQFVWVASPFRLNYDIALIELTEEVEFSDHVQPACIPHQSEELQHSSLTVSALNYNYTNCHIAGWGMRRRGGVVGGELQEVVVERMIAMQDCYNAYFAFLDAGMGKARDFCLFGRQAGRICKGDSGSPVFCERDGSWTVLGLGGWTLADCTIYVYNYPSVYTDVPVFSDWITARMYGMEPW